MGDDDKSFDEILGESLGAAYDAAEALPVEGDAGAASESAPASGPARDEHGRFAAKTDTGQAAQDAPAATNTDLGSKPADGAAPNAAPSDAPASWSDAEKAIWKTLPPDVQAIFARREADFSKGLEQKTQGYKALDDVIGPRREMLTRTYGSVENGVKELLGLSDFAVSKPSDFVKWFVHQHRLNPQDLFGGAPSGASEQGQPGGETPADPMAAVQAQINGFREEITRMVNAPIIAKAQTDLEKFEGEAATKHPHYSNPKVKQAMATLLAHSADDMTYEAAYESVVWSLPELRQTLIEAERKSAVEAQSKQADEAARKARTAAGPQLRSVAVPHAVQAGARSMDQTMSDTYDRLTGAA